eukprot:g20567.t1
METFFKRHFMKTPPGVRLPGRCRRTGWRAGGPVPGSKVRRRSNAGMPSALLAQRRRSSVQLPHSPHHHHHALARSSGPRRRSSTTALHLNPRFAVQQNPGGNLRAIDSHLVGPSVLLASLIQMSEDEEGTAQPCCRLRAGAAPDDSDSDCSSSGGSESSSAGRSRSDQEAGVCTPPGTPETLQPSAWRYRPVYTKPFLRAPRCLRRNSSHLVPAESLHMGKAAYGLQGKYRRRTQRRRSSTIPLPGTRRSSVAACVPPGEPELYRVVSVGSRRPSLSISQMSRALPPRWRHGVRRNSLRLIHRSPAAKHSPAWSNFL